jgi:hypothetical protein
MNQNTAGALFPSFAYSQFKKEVQTTLDVGQ